MPCGEKCCCVLGGCGCNPDGQRKALASLILEGVPELARSPAGTSMAWGAANYVLDNFDLVPKGVGQAAVKAYFEVFEENAGRHRGANEGAAQAALDRVAPPGGEEA